MKAQALIDQLHQEQQLSAGQWQQLIATADEDDCAYAAGLARELSLARFGRRVYTRGLIEFTNYCKYNCYYCGLRRDNREVERYRLSEQEVLDTCAYGWQLGFRTFVLQGGEDAYYQGERLLNLVKQIKARWPKAALTLSIGELDFAQYVALRAAGADRYLLRHETADAAHYQQLHPQPMQLGSRLACLRELKRLGYQTGCGMMVGTPGQTAATLAADMLLLAELKPEMVGIGPFLPHHQTPFATQPGGSVQLSLLLLSLTRLLLPNVLLPATTALATAQGDGRILGVLAGCNVVMPNISPLDQRHNYLLYDNKLGIDDPAAESLTNLDCQLQSIGYRLTMERGDFQAQLAEDKNND